MGKTVAVEFNGGCGNQLFQLAMGHAFSKKFSLRLIADIKGCDSSKSLHGAFHLSSIMKYFDLEEVSRFRTKHERVFSKTSAWLRNPIRVQRSDAISLYRSASLTNRNLVISGYEDRFFAIEAEKYGFKEVLAKFKEDELMDKRFETYNGKQITVEKCREFVAVHLRGTDMKVEKRFIPVSKVISLVMKEFSNEQFLVFSDDKELAMNFVKEIPNSWAILPQTNPLLELLLASECRSLVLSNSTFSFWISTLSDEKVIFSPVPKESVFAPIRPYLGFE